jgi:hypothetical protein
VGQEADWGMVKRGKKERDVKVKRRIGESCSWARRQTAWGMVKQGIERKRRDVRGIRPEKPAFYSFSLRFLFLQTHAASYSF